MDSTISSGSPEAGEDENGNMRPFDISAEEAERLRSELHLFLESCPVNWDAGQFVKRFTLFEEAISCVMWEGRFFITGTDVVKSVIWRFRLEGHIISDRKKFEEGVFSDLRNLKPGTDATLEEPRSRFLDFLYKLNCIRTHKKQKVFFWYSVPHDKLYQDALRRERKREIFPIVDTLLSLGTGSGNIDGSLNSSAIPKRILTKAAETIAAQRQNSRNHNAQPPTSSNNHPTPQNHDNNNSTRTAQVNMTGGHQSFGLNGFPPPIRYPLSSTNSSPPSSAASSIAHANLSRNNSNGFNQSGTYPRNAVNNNQNATNNLPLLGYNGYNPFAANQQTSNGISQSQQLYATYKTVSKAALGLPPIRGSFHNIDANNGIPMMRTDDNDISFSSNLPSSSLSMLSSSSSSVAHNFLQSLLPPFRSSAAAGGYTDLGLLDPSSANQFSRPSSLSPITGPSMMMSNPMVNNNVSSSNSQLPVDGLITPPYHHNDLPSPPAPPSMSLSSLMTSPSQPQNNNNNNTVTSKQQQQLYDYQPASSKPDSLLAQLSSVASSSSSSSSSSSKTTAVVSRSSPYSPTSIDSPSSASLNQVSLLPNNNSLRRDSDEFSDNADKWSASLQQQGNQRKRQRLSHSEHHEALTTTTTEDMTFDEEDDETDSDKYSLFVSHHDAASPLHVNMRQYQRELLEDLDMATSSRQHVYVCPLRSCHRQFKRFQHLKRHLVTHSGEKPFSCPAPGCEKSFARSDNLHQHLRIHSSGGAVNRHLNTILNAPATLSQQATVFLEPEGVL